MNIIKKLLASLTALVMAVGFMIGGSVPVRADTTGSTVNTATFTYEGTGATTDGKITLQNSTKDTTYTLYKIFDATFDGSGNVAYTTNSDVLKSALSPDYFTVSSKDANGNYSVTRTGTTDTSGKFTPTKNDTELIEYFKTLETSNFTDIGSIESPADGAITWNMIPYGYYLIKPNKPTETQAAVTIDSNTPTQNVIDKNQSTVLPDKQESVSSPADWKYIGNGHEETTIPSAQIGDTVNYKVVGSFTQYQGTTPVVSLKFTDTMSKGLTASKNVAVKINGTNLANSAFTAIYSTDSTSGVTTTTITIPTATVDETTKGVTFTYNANNTYEITYSATVNEKAITLNGEENTVTLAYTDDNNTEHNVGTDTTKVKNYNLTINKTDGTNPLPGAKFALYRTDADRLLNLKQMTDAERVAAGVQNAADNTIYYRIAKDGETDTTTTIDMSSHTTAIIYGLDGDDTYHIKETQAPNGYNILTNVIDQSMNNLNQRKTVENHKGSLLPSTGGIGTTIFYVAGGVIIIAAVGMIIARRKRNA